jgi:hypothetical protein
MTPPSKSCNSTACCGAIWATSGSAMRLRRADLVPFTVGAVAGVGFTVALISSANPPFHIALAIAMLVGSFVTGGIASVWMASGAAVKYLEFWEVPNWRPVRWFVQVLGAIGFAAIWSLGLFLVVRSLS